MRELVDPDTLPAIGCDLGAIVKSIVLRSDRGPLLALTSGANRVDYATVGRLLGAGEVDRADADLVRAATSFAIGGTAPLGHPRPLPTVVDRDLLAYELVWAAAGTPDTVFALTPRQLVAATRGTVAALAA